MPEKFEIIHIIIQYFKSFLNKTLLKNIIFFSGGIVLFFGGVLFYGMLLNLREKSIDEVMQERGIDELKDISIVIDKSRYELQLYEGGTLLKTYRASFGRNPSNIKNSAYDNATPAGSYVIKSIDTNHIYHRFFNLNYPNENDITYAFQRGVITQKHLDDLKFKYYHSNEPIYDSVLGGKIGIQGIGKFNFIIKNLPFVFNWTDGSIALSDEGIDELFKIIKVNTKVIIK